MFQHEPESALIHVLLARTQAVDASEDAIFGHEFLVTVDGEMRIGLHSRVAVPDLFPRARATALDDFQTGDRLDARELIAIEAH